MAFKIKSKAGRKPKSIKFRTIKNFKALKGFEFFEIKKGKMYFKKKKDETKKENIPTK